MLALGLVLPAPGEPAIEITVCDANTVSTHVKNWIYELSDQPS